MGFGGALNANVLRLPELSFVFGAETDRIPNVDVLLQATDQFSKRFDGDAGRRYDARVAIVRFSL